MNNQAALKLFAMYFPQLHAIPENSKWWGEGFTDWNNVQASQKQFAGHNQPRVPLNKKYYDQSKIDTIRWQIDLAKEHNVFGFCHYHYWFDGKQLLETPTNLVMENRDIDFPFCLSWANETWSKRWDGQNRKILIKQTHPPSKDRWKLHFDYLIKAWGDPRAICIDDKPVFVIYRPHYIKEIDQMLDYWRELAHQAGLKGLYIIAQKQFEFPVRESVLSFDGTFQFQPFEAIHSSMASQITAQKPLARRMANRLPESVKGMLRDTHAMLFKSLTIHDYDAVWEQIIRVRPDETLTTFPGAFVDWDNTARYKNRATIFEGATPEKFENWFGLLADSMAERNLPENFVFLNAWNEWSEGTYLEPDEIHGYRY